MIATLNENRRRASWKLRALLISFGMAVLTLPLVYLTRAEVAQAESSPAPTEAKTAPETQHPESDLPAQPVIAEFSTESEPEPQVEYFPEPTDGEKRIAEALDTQMAIEFTETPLIDAITFINDKLEGKVEIQLDHRALEDAGVGGDTPVTRRLKPLPVRTALRFLLDDMDLTYLIRDEVLVITTVDKADAELITRTYPVGDLLSDVSNAVKGGVRPKRAASGGGMFAVPSDAPNAQPTSKLAPVPASAPKAIEVTVRKDYDSLIEAITTTVYPPTWDEVGGPGSIVPVSVSRSLVISQTQQVHDGVLQLLRALRAAKRGTANVTSIKK